MRRDGINFPDISRWLYYCKDVGAETNEYLFSRLGALYQKAPKAAVLLFVGTTGGDPGHALAFYRWVKFLNIPLITVGIGEIASCGSIILLVGNKRYLLPGTHIYFHVGTSSTSAETQRIEAKGRIKVLEHEEKQMREIICAQTLLKPAQLSKYEMSSRFISDEKAVEYGFASKIVGGLAPDLINRENRVVRKPKFRLVARR